ncbi:MAG: hypothetical protein AB7J19_00465, partial [Beijerinckiaceae bacterium]
MPRKPNNKEGSASVDAVASQFEEALAAETIDYAAVLAAFRALVIPTNVSAEQLERLTAICYRILNLDGADQPVRLLEHMENRPAGHLMACAEEVINDILFDRNASTRKWIAESIAGFHRRGQPLPEGLGDDHLPPEVDIPWSRAQAETHIRPFLHHYESGLKSVPTAHVGLCWNVFRDGHAVFQGIFEDWLKDLDRRKLGQRGTLQAIRKAFELGKMADRGLSMSWAECEADILPLLDHDHPLIVSHAARVLGSLYSGDTPDEEMDLPIDLLRDGPPLVDILDKLRTHKNFPYAACGGFINGFDSDLSGLYSLDNDERLKQVGFDLDGWIFDVLKADFYEPYLPGSQAFWFYLHEHYDYNPAAVM